MSTARLPPPADPNEEISALIETLHKTGQRLEELTGGEVDTVTDRDGRMVLLRRAQDHLRHSEAAKQAAILNALPAHIALLDAQGRIVSVNQAWRRFAGSGVVQAPGHEIGLDYLGICDSARGKGAFTARQAAAGVRSVLDGAAQSFSIEYACHSPGEQRWFLMTVTPLTDDQRKGAVVMHLNITGQKRAAEEQRATSHLLDNIVENIPTAVQLKSVRDDYRIQMWNKAAEAMYGLPREAAIGRNVHDLWPEADANLMRDADLALVNQGGIQDFADRPVPTKDRGVIHVHLRKVGLVGADGEVAHLLVIADDISEQLKRTEELRRFSAAMDATPDGIMLVDRSTMRFIHVNDAACYFMNLPRKELLALEPWVSASASTSRADLERSYDALIASGIAAEPSEVMQARKDGSSGWVEIRRLAQRSAEGWTIVVLARDITERKLADNIALLEKSFTNAVLDNLPGLFYLIDDKGRFLRWNKNFEKVSGYSAEEISRLAPTQFFEGADKDSVTATIGRVFLSGEATVEAGFVAKDRSSTPYLLTGKLVAMEGQPCLIGTGMDLTVRRRAEADRKRLTDNVRRLNRVYAVLSGINTLIVRARDRDELFREATRIAVEHGQFRMAWIGIVNRATGRIDPVASAGEVRDFFDVAPLDITEANPDNLGLAGRAIAHMKPMISNDVHNDPQRLMRKEMGERGINSLALLPLIVDGEAIGILALYSADVGFFDEEEMKLLLELAGDISFAIDHLAKEEKINYLAYFDALTGLANRSLFLERVAQSIIGAAAKAGALAVIVVDVERFKLINETLGRTAGDELLRQVAGRLAPTQADQVRYARIGADQFVAVSPAVESVEWLMRRVEASLERIFGPRFKVGDTELKIAARLGIAIFPDDGADAETLLTNAEFALKRAKASGDKYLFYTQQMTDRVAGRLSMENQLRQALEREEFVLFYQPKVNLGSGKLSAAEALIRWNDPRTGLVPPGRFIPILEETGLIYEVGRWALHKAIADYLRWCAAGLPAVRIAVNVSPLQLRNRNFIEEVKQAIGADPHAAAGLELEITESLIMEDVERNIAILKSIREMGVSIALDDFGTGYSSLSLLGRLPVNTLKIDRSFIIEMTLGPNGLALVQTIITLAHSLGLKVVAEGVETEEQSHLLRLLSCDEMQGFLFSKPVPAETFEAKFLLATPVA